MTMEMGADSEWVRCCALRCAAEKCEAECEVAGYECTKRGKECQRTSGGGREVVAELMRLRATAERAELRWS